MSKSSMFAMALSTGLVDSAADEIKEQRAFNRKKATMDRGQLYKMQDRAQEQGIYQEKVKEQRAYNEGQIAEVRAYNEGQTGETRAYNEGQVEKAALQGSAFANVNTKATYDRLVDIEDPQERYDSTLRLKESDPEAFSHPEVQEMLKQTGADLKELAKNRAYFQQAKGHIYEDPERNPDAIYKWRKEGLEIINQLSITSEEYKEAKRLLEEKYGILSGRGAAQPEDSAAQPFVPFLDEGNSTQHPVAGEPSSDTPPVATATPGGVPEEELARASTAFSSESGDSASGGASTSPLVGGTAAETPAEAQMFTPGANTEVLSQRDAALQKYVGRTENPDTGKAFESIAEIRKYLEAQKSMPPSERIKGPRGDLLDEPQVLRGAEAHMGDIEADSAGQAIAFPSPPSETLRSQKTMPNVGDPNVRTPPANMPNVTGGPAPAEAAPEAETEMPPAMAAVMGRQRPDIPISPLAPNPDAGMDEVEGDNADPTFGPADVADMEPINLALAKMPEGGVYDNIRTLFKGNQRPGEQTIEKIVLMAQVDPDLKELAELLRPGGAAGTAPPPEIANAMAEDPAAAMGEESAPPTSSAESGSRSTNFTMGSTHGIEFDTKAGTVDKEALAGAIEGFQQMPPEEKEYALAIAEVEFWERKVPGGINMKTGKVGNQDLPEGSHARGAWEAWKKARERSMRIGR